MNNSSNQIKAFDLAIKELQNAMDAIPNQFISDEANARYQELRKAQHTLEAFRNALAVTA